MPHHSRRAVTQPAAGGIDTLGGGDPGGSQNFFGIILKFGLTVCWKCVYSKIMKRTNIHLTEQQRAKLAKLAKKTGLTVAEMVRRAIDAFLKKHP